jgi:hypothetical protein
MAIDLNKVPGEGSEESLPNLNQQPAEDEGDQLHLIQEAQVHPLNAQSHYLQKEQHGDVQAIDLNIPACEGQQEEYHKGNISLSFFTKMKCTVYKNFDPYLKFYAPVLAVEDVHQQDGDFNFDTPHVLDDFYLSLEAPDHQNDLQQVNSKPQCNMNFFCFSIIFSSQRQCISSEKSTTVC